MEERPEGESASAALIPFVAGCILEPGFSKWGQWNQQRCIAWEIVRSGGPQPRLRHRESEPAFQQEPGLRGLHAQYGLGGIALGSFQKPQRVLLLG